LQKGIWRVLISKFNPSNLGKGMEKLLNDGNIMLTLVKSTNAITAGSIIKAAKTRSDELTASSGKTVLPSITAQAEAQEEANQLNVINQSVIGAKEGVVKAINKLVGSNVTNAILWTANGSNHKSICQIHTTQSDEIRHQRLQSTIHKRHVGAAAQGYCCSPAPPAQTTAALKHNLDNNSRPSALPAVAPILSRSEIQLAVPLHRHSPPHPPGHPALPPANINHHSLNKQKATIGSNPSPQFKSK
jgi:hypothetical protein